MNKYPLLRIDGLFNQLHGAKVFSQMDLAIRFHKLRLVKKSVPITAFLHHRVSMRGW